MTATTTRDSAFVDCYQVMQVHPRADASMIDAAYWHLARRYSEALIRDPSQKRKLDELNDAYSIIGSPARREAYDSDRALVLGVDALPQPPIQQEYRQPAPLAVMERHKPRAAREPTFDDESSSWERMVRLALLRWRGFLPAFGAILLAIGGVAASAPLAVVGASLALAVLSAVLPLAGRRRADRFPVGSMVGARPPDDAPRPPVFNPPPPRHVAEAPSEETPAA